MNLAMDSVKLPSGSAGQDFRDQLSTADQEGRRRWLFPKQPAGRFYRIRMAVSWLLIGLMFAGPFITIQGNPLLMFNKKL